MSAWFCLGPDQRITSGPAAKAAASRWRQASRRKQAEYMTAPERFAEKSDSLLHRGRRPYMTHSVISRPSIAALRKAVCPCQTWRAPRRWRPWPASIAGGGRSNGRTIPLANIGGRTAIRLSQHDQSIILETQPRPECPCARQPGKHVWFVPFQISARIDPEATPWLGIEGEHRAWKYPGQDNRTCTSVSS